MSKEEMEKVEVLERIIDLTQSSFVDDNYTSSNIHQLINECVEYTIEELDDYGIDYIEEEIKNYFNKKINL